MTLVFCFIVFLAALSPLLLLLAIGRLLVSRRENPRSPVFTAALGYPVVSLMIAARNEERNIVACLDSVDRLTYPKERLEVLIGNDHSEDATQARVEQYIRGKPWFRLVNIGENLGNTRGKANVLAHLTQQARGQYFFFTDADMELPRGWVEQMLGAFEPVNGRETGVVTGFTVIKGSSFFARLQEIDWLYSLGTVCLLSNLGIPVSTLGNNMAVTRRAYFATTGYERLPFSITEDHQLFHEIVRRGFAFRQLMEPGITAVTKPMPDLRHWLHQRKRWMKAALHSVQPLRGFILLQILFFPLLFCTYQFNPPAAFALLVSRVVLQALYINVVATCVLRQGPGPAIFLFELYTIFLNSILLLFYFLPTKINWKNREY